MATQPVTEAPKVSQETMDRIAGAIECSVKMMPKEDDPEAYVKNFANIFRQEGVEYLKIDFDGSGDSGSITGIYLSADWTQQVEGKLDTLLQEWAYELLETTHVDWYNNDGGYGEIVFDVANRKFSYKVYQRTTSSELGASGEEEI